MLHLPNRLAVLVVPGLLWAARHSRPVAALLRFREPVPNDDGKPQWERKGEGIAPLAPDTEVVENIHEHR